MFSTYKEVDGEHLYIRNSSTSKVLGVGKFILKMTSEKLMTFNNVLYVDDIRMNLMSSSLLSKNSFKLIFENEKFILLKKNVTWITSLMVIITLRVLLCEFMTWITSLIGQIDQKIKKLDLLR